MTEVTQEQLEELKNNGKKILLELYGVWCGPCKTLMPRLSNLSTKYPDITFIKMDVDLNVDFIKSLDINTVPTIMIYNGDTLISRSLGANIDSVYTKILDTL